MFCLSPPSSPCCRSTAGDWHSTVQLVAAYISPQLWGDRVDPGFLFLLTREHSSSSRFGGEVEGNPLRRFLAQQPKAALCSPEELHGQRPWMRDLGQPSLMSWRFPPIFSPHHPAPPVLAAALCNFPGCAIQGTASECFV